MHTANGNNNKSSHINGENGTNSITNDTNYYYVFNINITVSNEAETTGILEKLKAIIKGSQCEGIILQTKGTGKLPKSVERHVPRVDVSR